MIVLKSVKITQESEFVTQMHPHVYAHRREIQLDLRIQKGTRRLEWSLSDRQHLDIQYFGYRLSLP